MAPPEVVAASSGSPAGYGRSCTNCSRAKCKCILRTGGGACERCHRLGKECHQMASSRRRIGKKVAPSRAAKLEEKLDDLVSILRATQPNGQVPSKISSLSPLTTETPPTAGFSSRLDSLATAAQHSSSHDRRDGWSPYPYPTGGNPAQSEVDPSVSSINETYRLPEPTPEEAELYLNKFRRWLVNFPFMVMPQDMTAAELRKQSPFLWMCIMNLTTMSIPQQQMLREKVRETIATRTIVNQERNMDLLLGLICYMTWATMNAGPGSKPFLIIYSQMALAIVYDLGLTRAPIEEQFFTMNFKIWAGRAPPAKLRTMEERRAVVSLWFLTSIVTSFIGKMDSFRWTPHMEECLQVLEGNQEQPPDEVLAKLVRLQLIGDEAQRLLIRDVMGDMNQVPTYVYKKGLLSKLQEVREGFSMNAISSQCLKLHHVGVEVLVHLVGLSTADVPQTQRIESMFSCLKAVRRWYDIFFATPLEDMPATPFAVFTNLSQTQVALHKLTTSEEPGWDKELVRNTADLLLLLDQMIDMFQRVNSVYTFKTDGDDETLYVKGCKIMRNLRASWEPILGPHLSGLPTPSSQELAAQNDESGMAEQSILSEANSADFGDLSWMTDIFGPLES